MFKRIMSLMIVVPAVLYAAAAQATYYKSDLEIFKNDKEPTISSFGKGVKKSILTKYKEPGLKSYIEESFQTALLDFLNYENLKCETLLIKYFEQNLAATKVVPHAMKDIEAHLKFLRSSNKIDDIFYELLSGINKDYFGLKEVDLNQNPGHLFLKHDELLKNNNISSQFKAFKIWPEDKGDSCSYQEFMNLKVSVRNEKDERAKHDHELKLLTIKAMEDGLISLESYHKLNYLREKSFIMKRDLWLQDYIKITLSAKNKMVPLNYVYKIRNIEEENDFSVERVKRFTKLTRRKLLYRKYDETQIILLSQVLQRAARRMGSDPDTESKAPIITQEFSTLLKSGKRETYVEKIELDPQSQYNLARRLMRKDILDLNVMDGFKALKITYEDVVMAALETGYITLEDIEFVVKYDDLWNSPESKFEKIMHFIFRCLGFSTFYLPPPWNITAAIALGVVEGIIDTQFNKKGSDHDNPATFIE